MCALRRSYKGILKKTNKYDCVAHNHLDYLPIYRVWQNMVRRCTNPKSDMFYAYGGRGIKVCDRWLDKDAGFINFYNDMGERPVDEKGKPYQIDRIDNNGDYCPENCRWVSNAKNAQNKRSNVMFLINGEEMCLASVVKLFDFSRDTIRQRMKRNGEDKYSALFSILSNKGYELSPLTNGKDML